MNPLRLKVQQKIFKLLVNKAERLKTQGKFIIDEHFLKFVKYIEDLESYVEDIFIFEACPQYYIFSEEIEVNVKKLDELHATIYETLNAKTPLVPSELLKKAVIGIEK